MVVGISNGHLAAIGRNALGDIIKEQAPRRELREKVATITRRIMSVRAVLDDAGNVSLPCTMLDVSENGCCLSIGTPIAVGTVFRLNISGASSMRAVVRWVRGREHGVEILK